MKFPTTISIVAMMLIVSPITSAKEIFPAPDVPITLHAPLVGSVVCPEGSERTIEAASPTIGLPPEIVEILRQVECKSTD